jgi:hypothetical protein
MKIDYAIISSDQTEMYKSFYPLVSKRWNKIGIPTFYLEICDEESDIYRTEYGIAKKVKQFIPNKSLPSDCGRLPINGYLAQLVRIYAYSFLKNKNMLISDIDMYPINASFFIDNAHPYSDDTIITYTQKSPFYPMCYILGNSAVLSDVFKLNGTFEEFTNRVISLNLWDESYLDYTIDAPSMPYPRIHINRPPNNARLDRLNWSYNENNIANYIDAHLLRPYKDYKDKIDRLIELT